MLTIRKRHGWMGTTYDVVDVERRGPHAGRERHVRGFASYSDAHQWLGERKGAHGRPGGSSRPQSLLEAFWGC